MKRMFLTFVTRYEKRDRSEFFVDSAFSVWIVSAIGVESNGASLEKNILIRSRVMSFFLYPGRPLPRNGRL